MDHIEAISGKGIDQFQFATSVIEFMDSFNLRQV